MLDSGSTPPPDRRPSQHSKRRRFRGFTVTSQRPELDQAVVISKALDLRPEFYAEHMPPCNDLSQFTSNGRRCRPGLLRWFDQLVLAHPHLTRQQALLHVLNQDPELYLLRWPKQ